MSHRSTWATTCISMTPMVTTDRSLTTFRQHSRYIRMCARPWVDRGTNRCRYSTSLSHAWRGRVLSLALINRLSLHSLILTSCFLIGMISHQFNWKTRESAQESTQMSCLSGKSHWPSRALPKMSWLCRNQEKYYFRINRSPRILSRVLVLSSPNVAYPVKCTYKPPWTWPISTDLPFCQPRHP